MRESILIDRLIDWC